MMVVTLGCFCCELRRIGLLVFFGWAASMKADAVLDLDGDGVSEIWSLLYPNATCVDKDFDGDGFSNFEESVAGTNPEEGTSYLSLEIVGSDRIETTFGWEAQVGKSYILQTWDHGAFKRVNARTVPEVAAPTTATITLPSTHYNGLYRLVVSNLDRDRDGLSAWEESLLGSSDQNPYSTASSSANDFETALRGLESVSGLQLIDGRMLPQRLPTAYEASRFLVQTSFGPTSESIAEVMRLGLGEYFDAQIELPPK